MAGAELPIDMNEQRRLSHGETGRASGTARGAALPRVVRITSGCAVIHSLSASLIGPLSTAGDFFH